MYDIVVQFGLMWCDAVWRGAVRRDVACRHVVSRGAMSFHAAPCVVFFVALVIET